MIRNDNEFAPFIMAGQETVARVSLNLIVFMGFPGFVCPSFVRTIR